MSVLVPTSLFPIDIKYAEVKLKSGMTGNVVIDDDDEENLKKYEGKIKELHTQWLQPGWKENNNIVRESMYWDEFRGVRDVDFYVYRALVLERFLKVWDVKDDKGQPVPCTPETAARLDIQVATSLVSKFLSRNVPTEEDLKN
jgi:hypothetical protein